MKIFDALAKIFVQLSSTLSLENFNTILHNVIDLQRARPLRAFLRPRAIRKIVLVRDYVIKTATFNL